MKKVYTLAAAALLGASVASAFNAQIDAQVKEGYGKFNRVTKKEATLMADTPASLKKAPAKAGETAPEFNANEYTWVLLGNGKYKPSVVADIYGLSPDAVDVKVYEAEGHTGLYKVEGVWPEFTPEASLYVDASDPTWVTVPRQNAGIEDTVDGITYIASENYVLNVIDGYDKSIITEVAPEVVLTNEDGVINFPAESLVLQWPEAPADSEYGTEADGWYIGESDGYLVLPGANFVEEWTSYGTGKFLENMIWPLFTGEENKTEFDVEVLYKTENPSLLKVVSPFSGLHEKLGTGVKCPDMELDATDPSNVLIGLMSTGLRGATDGLYGLFSESWYNGNYGEGASTTEEALRITLETTADGATTITIPVNSTIVLGSSSGKGYLGSPYVSTLKFQTTGISNVAADFSNANAAVEYFNLQGQKVLNPGKGELVIKRQGNEVSKMIVR